MSDTNLACVVKEKGILSLKEFPEPKPGPGTVKIAIGKVGICGTDVHMWKYGGLNEFVVKEPLILGHEPAGTVTELGQGVTSLKVGDRVAIEPGVPCRQCEFCRKGLYNLCHDIEGLSLPPFHGTIKRYHVHAADFCYKLPDHVSLEEGALLEPLSVAVYACQTGEVSLGKTVLICGAGSIGLLCLLTAKAMGASSICITDIKKSRLETAKKLGVSHTVLVDTQDTKVVAENIVHSYGTRPDISIECSAVEASVQTAVYATKSGGCVVIVGLGKAVVQIPILDATLRQVTVKGIYRYPNCYPIALSMVATGQIDVKPLVTHRFNLEESLEAFEIASTGVDGAMKVMIDCSKKK